LGSDDTSTYPGSGPSTPEVKPLFPSLVFILSTGWLTVLLGLYCLEEEEEGFDLPTPRVQVPLYRRGSGYSLVVRLPGCRLPRGCGLGMGPALLCPLPGRMLLYKAHFPLGSAYPGYMPPVCLRSFRGGGLARCGWWRPCVAGVTPISSLCRSSRDLATFNKASIEGFRRLCQLGPPVVKMSACCWRSRLLGRS
jgi:hypothetical protein